MLSRIALLKASQLLHSGAVIAYPTEAVYGLGCDPHNEEAVHHLLAIKKRPVEKGMILVCANLDQALPYMQPQSPEALKIMTAPRDVPTTWLVEKSSHTPYWISGKHSKVAIRISQHPVVRQLCLAFGDAIVSTSANLAGHPAARSALQVQRHLGGELDWISPGKLGGYARPSEIRDLTTGQIMRPA